MKQFTDIISDNDVDTINDFLKYVNTILRGRRLNTEQFTSILKTLEEVHLNLHGAVDPNLD